MNLDNFIFMGSFYFNDVIIKEYKTGFTGGLFITISKYEEPTHYIGVIIEQTNGFDIVGAMRKQTHVNINGAIYKNPKSEKILYIVDDANENFEII